MKPERRKITIVDDQQIVLRQMEDLLKLHLHYEIESFLDIDQALNSIIHENGNSMIMLDCMMPNVDDGERMLHQIRQSGIECPVIMFSCEAVNLERFENKKGVYTWVKSLDQVELVKLSNDIEEIVDKWQTKVDLQAVKTDVRHLKQNMRLINTTNEKILDTLESLTNEIKTQPIIEQDKRSIWVKMALDPVTKPLCALVVAVWGCFKYFGK